MLEKGREAIVWWDEDTELGMTGGGGASEEEWGGTQKVERALELLECPAELLQGRHEASFWLVEGSSLLLSSTPVADSASKKPPLYTTPSSRTAPFSPPTPTASLTPSSPSDSSPPLSLRRRRSTPSHPR